MIIEEMLKLSIEYHRELASEMYRDLKDEYSALLDMKMHMHEKFADELQEILDDCEV